VPNASLVTFTFDLPSVTQSVARRFAGAAFAATATAAVVIRKSRRVRDMAQLLSRHSITLRDHRNMRFALFFLTVLAAAQPISFGIKAGVPISPFSRNDPQQCLPANAQFAPCGPNDTLIKPYIIGGTIELHLPLNFSLEADGLYERLHQDFTVGLVIPRGSGGVHFGQRAALGANEWTVPLLVKYTVPHRRIAPFVAAGATMQFLSDFKGNGIEISFFGNPEPKNVRFVTEQPRVAITAGAGLRLRALGVAISPEIRYLHWTSVSAEPVQNRALFLLGITWPAPRIP
jgi:hypothetical protein